MINNSTPIPDTKHRGSVRPFTNTGDVKVAGIGEDITSDSNVAHRFKKMIEKARPSTPLGGSY